MKYRVYWNNVTSEQQQWLIENVKPCRDFPYMGMPWDNAYYHESLTDTLKFVRKEDAVAFKLRWL